MLPVSKFMTNPIRFLLTGLLTLTVFPAAICCAAPVINEIMYRPGTTYPENTGLEYIEIHNPDAADADISGWALTSGVDYTFPPGTVIPAGGFVLAGANPAALNALWSRSFLGPWAAGATLANNGEKITLSMPGAIAGTWIKVDEVRYASEGDWGQRFREAAWDGWDWQSPAATGGKSMELRNSALSNDNGQNWAASTASAGGTPGEANTSASSNVPPVIHSVKHSPAVPLSTEPVVVSCEVNDEAPAGSRAASLFYRNVTTASPPAFTSVAMTGDGTGKFSATIPAAPNKSIFEFYISSSDGAGTRTWPAATTTGQNANCLYQVDNELDPPGADIYRLVLTAADNTEWTNLSSGSDRQYNMSFIARRGTENTIRYLSSMRTRGNSSRSYQFRPLRISIPNGDDWDGSTGFNLNPKASFLQFIGMKLFQASGLPTPDAVPVEMRRNGLEQTTSGGDTPDYGRWVRVEDPGGEMVSRQWPLASGGNIYKKGRPDEFWRSNASAPSSPAGLLDGWSKQNNSAANDWSDLTGFFATCQSVAGPHFPGAPAGDAGNGAAWNRVPYDTDDIGMLETVADLNQWARWFAVMTLLQSNETNISNGQDDDYAAYFVPSSGGRRLMQLLPHDLDTILGKGDNTSSHGLYDMTDDGSVFTPLLPLIGNSNAPGNAEFRNRYHLAIRQLFGTVFNADTAITAKPSFHVFIDNYLTGWVPAAVRTDLKNFMTARQSALLAAIASGPITPPAATANPAMTSSHGALMISEVLASNISAHTNRLAFPDVIELHNSGTTPVDLSGKSLTDDPLQKVKFVFAASATLPPGGYLVLYADSDFAAPGLHTGFQLDQGGDTVYLYDAAGADQALLDSVTFGPQAANFSIGRSGAGLNSWALGSPTIGDANTTVTLEAPGVLRINEWLGNPDFRVSEDYLEIYNPAAGPVAMGGMRITDDAINYRSRHVLPALSFIGPEGFQVFKAKGGVATPGNAVELPFGIDSTSGWLALIGANDVTVSGVFTVSHFRDTSTGSSSDGDAAHSVLPFLSPGISNTPLSAGYQALVNSLRITEFNYKPTGGSDFEFVELYNTGTAMLKLGGVRFTSGIDYTFNAGTDLWPGGFIVVCRNPAQFLTRFPNVAGLLAAGSYMGALDNSGERITLSLPKPWDVAILNFSYQTSWEPLTFNNGYSLTTVDAAMTAARDWGDRSAWTASGVVHGTPGSYGPPSITSPLSASGIAGDVFSYQITASRGPLSFGAEGLPAGLTVDTAGGLISGTPAAEGTFPVAISAVNPAGAGAQLLTLTIASSGPLSSFTWDGAPSGAESGVPFAAWLTARDIQGRVVTSFNGTVPVTAADPAGQGTSTVVITEFSDESEDQFEIQNTGSAAVNTDGWFVRLGHSSGINEMNTTTWPLPASIPEGGLLRVTELSGQVDRAYFGANISWNIGAAKGWIMLLDAGTKIRDFVAWGWTAGELAALSVLINDQTVTVGGQWSGNGPVVGTRAGNTDAFRRTGTSDTNSAADWSWSTGVTSWGATNEGLTLPWVTGTPVNLSPSSLVFSNGIFTGFLAASPQASGVRMTLKDGAKHTGISAPFDIIEPAPDTDGDMLPDAWELTNGTNPATPDTVLDTDGDGFSNLAEYYAGTDPQSAASVLRVEATGPTGGQFNLAWPAHPGRLYRVFSSPDLTSWNWVAGHIYLPASAGTQNATIPAPATRQLYRVHLLTP